MNKEFVSIEIALQLKQLGFQDECLGFYYYDGSFNSYRLIYTESSSDYMNVVPAPLWQQVFDWLETKKVFISIEYVAPDTNEFHYRLDNYNPVYRVFESRLINKNWERVDTGKTAGEFSIYSKTWYATRIECTKAAIDDAITLINKPMGAGTITSVKF